MCLTLRAVSLNDHPLTRPITVRFDAEGGSIGRADHNTMALPDPKRHISRQQARVATEAGGYTITNVGSANPIVLGTRSLARGESALLAQGDRLGIGGYLLEVEVEVGGGADADAASITRGRAVVDAAAPLPARAPAGADPAPPLSPANPFAGMFPQSPASAGSAVHGSPPRLPDDFDAFAPPVPVAAPGAPAAFFAPTPTGVFGDLVPGGEPASLDRLFGLGAGDGRDPLADFMASAPSPPAAAGHAQPPPWPSDPLALLGLASAAAAPGGAPTASDHVPELHAAFVPPRPVRSPAPDSPCSDPAGADASTAWAAFCAGAGIATLPPGGGEAEAMRRVGALLRASVDGTLRLMAVRASSKHELHAPVTVIQSQRNNPLKFSPDADAALAQLLQPPLRGFLPGVEAVGDAMDDLVGHAIGTLAGTRAALEGVLDRFAPRQLEDKLAARSVLDSVLPMNRKARLWALYLQHFESIRSEAQDDFHSLFGRAFLAAYAQQLERLRGPAAGR